MWNLTCLSDIVLDNKLPGDKIILPHNILSEYINTGNIHTDSSNESQSDTQSDTQVKEIDFPLSFKISYANKEIIVSVLDFTGESDTVVIPEWIFYNLYPIQLGDIVTVSVYSGGYTENKLPKGTLIKLRPHTIDFLDIEDHKTILEHTLKNYSILNKYTTISIEYLGIQHNIDIIDTKPVDVIDINNSDVEVEFDGPLNTFDLNNIENNYKSNELDYESPYNPDGDHDLDGDHDNLDGDHDNLDGDHDNLDGDHDNLDRDHDPPTLQKKKFVPFSGKGNVLGSS